MEDFEEVLTIILIKFKLQLKVFIASPGDQKAKLDLFQLHYQPYEQNRKERVVSI